MSWDNAIADFLTYLRLEKSLGEKTLTAYSSDVEKLRRFIEGEYRLQPQQVTHTHVEQFLAHVYDLGLNSRSQARVLSGVRAFFQYLLCEDAITANPTQQIDGPQDGRKLPVVLSVGEIEKIIAAR